LLLEDSSVLKEGTGFTAGDELMSACAAEAALLELSAAGGQSPLKSRKLVSHESVAASLCLDLAKIVSYAYTT
jgi:hypothetical protein